MLHSFSGDDGAEPEGIAADKAGNFYITTEVGGHNNDGAVAKLLPGHAVHVLHFFSGADGAGAAQVRWDRSPPSATRRPIFMASRSKTALAIRSTSAHE